jgi:FkbM family methyltransferase
VHGGDTGIAPHLLLDGVWEIWMTEFVARNITPGANVMDIGANYGYYTVLMGHLGGKDGKVISVEPNPSILPFLEKNILVNKLRSKVIIDRRAVSEKSGDDVNFYCPNAEPKNAKIVSAEVAARLPKAGGNLVKVKSIALDDLDLTDISFIKVDVEGAEDKFWLGSKKFLIRNPNAIILLEFNPSRVQNPEDILDDISTMYPLRYLASDGHVYETTRDYLISNAKGDWMIVLANRPFN